MTLALIHHTSAQGVAALQAAQDRCIERNDLLLVLAAGSGSNAPEAAALEYQALVEHVRANLTRDVRWRVELVEPGQDPTASIIDHLQVLRPDEVVLGTRHRSTVGKMFLGQAVNRFLLEIDAPILLIKPPPA